MGSRRIRCDITHLLCESAWLSQTPVFANIHVMQRFLLPLLTRSLQARVSIKAHQKDLLLRLTASIQALKATQHEAFSVLPRPGSVREDAEFKDCHTLEQIIAASGETPQDIPPFSVLRCTLEEFSAQGKDADTDGLFQAITSKLEWMQSDEGNRYQVSKNNPLELPERSLMKFIRMTSGRHYPRTLHSATLTQKQRPFGNILLPLLQPHLLWYHHFNHFAPQCPLLDHPPIRQCNMLCRQYPNSRVI